ncbi:MAG: ABC transporter substrate-binding protein [Chlamydiota bacterium]
MATVIDKNQKSGFSKKETLTLNFVEGDLESLSPYSLSLCLRGRALGKWLFEGLTRLSPCGSYKPAGARKITISPCQTSYLFALRPMRYSDGSFVSAYDYERAWKGVLSSDVDCKQAGLFDCLKNAKAVREKGKAISEVGVKALNQNTLLVELERPNTYFLSLLSSCLFVPYKTKFGKVLFNGPYQVDEWERDRYLRLTINSFFQEQDTLEIKQIKILMVKNHQEVFSLYKRKELDWIGDPFCPLPKDRLSLELVQGKWTRKEVVRPFWIHLNTQHFPLSSPLIRRAFSCAVNRKWLSEHIYPGCRPLSTVLPKALSLYGEGNALCQDTGQGETLFEEGLKELRLTRKTFPLLKLSCCPMERNQKLAEYLKEKWETTFGITIDLDIQDCRVFLENLRVGKFQIGGCFVSSDYKDALTLLARLAAVDNCCHWNHFHYRDIVACIEREKKPHIRCSLIRAAESILIQEAPVIGLLNQTLNYIHRDDLHNLTFDYAGVPDLRWARLSHSLNNPTFSDVGQKTKSIFS